MDEVEAAIKGMKKGKAPGMDNITIEEIEAATQGSGLKTLHQLLSTIWDKEEIPSDWKKSVITPIYKKKDKLDCNNYRGISLLCHGSKLFSSIILQRIKNRTEEILSEAQAGFRVGRSTVDQIFTLRQLAEKYAEFGRDIFVCYVDFRKAFDSVWRKGLWRVLRHYGYPEKIIRILENMYSETLSAVRTNGDLSDFFEATVGVLQGCVLSPLLFNVFLEAIMALALDGSEKGVVLDGNIIDNLRFADDIAATAESVVDLQEIVNRINGTSKRMGMAINEAKTETQHLGRDTKEVDISLDNGSLKQSEDFVYLGGNMSQRGGTAKDIERRIGLARGVVQQLNRVWTTKDISTHTKLNVYEVLVLSVLMYNSETSVLREEDKRRVRVFEMACLRKILGVTKMDRLHNTSIRERVGYQEDIVLKIQRRRLRYFGHISRMEMSRYPYMALHGRVHGTRGKGRPRKRWSDMISQDCLDAEMTLEMVHRKANDRQGWRNFVNGMPTHSQLLQRQ